MSRHVSRGGGTANQIGGKIQKGVGHVIGDPDMEARGAGREAAGKVEKESAKAGERARGKIDELHGKAKEVGGKIRQKVNR